MWGELWLKVGTVIYISLGPTFITCIPMGLDELVRGMVSSAPPQTNCILRTNIWTALSGQLLLYYVPVNMYNCLETSKQCPRLHHCLWIGCSLYCKRYKFVEADCYSSRLWFGKLGAVTFSYCTVIFTMLHCFVLCHGIIFIILHCI